MDCVCPAVGALAVGVASMLFSFAALTVACAYGIVMMARE